jgi:hypothetical protein
MSYFGKEQENILKLYNLMLKIKIILNLFNQSSVSILKYLILKIPNINRLEQIIKIKKI